MIWRVIFWWECLKSQTKCFLNTCSKWVARGAKHWTTKLWQFYINMAMLHWFFAVSLTQGQSWNITLTAVQQAGMLLLCNEYVVNLCMLYVVNKYIVNLWETEQIYFLCFRENKTWQCNLKYNLLKICSKTNQSQKEKWLQIYLVTTLSKSKSQLSVKLSKFCAGSDVVKVCNILQHG